jgi:hypothetical protein
LEVVGCWDISPLEVVGVGSLSSCQVARFHEEVRQVAFVNVSWVCVGCRPGLEVFSHGCGERPS